MPKGILPYGRQSVDVRDVRAAVRALKSAWLTQGPAVARFEEAFAKAVDAPYAVAVSSGTAGLHLAALAAGFGPGDEAITSPNTFVATANSFLYVGARPRFADIDPRTLGLAPAKAAAAVTDKTKGIVPVHFAGLPCPAGPKSDYSSRKDFAIIEDACHALGAEYRSDGSWKKIGNCESSDMAVFSFHPVKLITTGEGGMVTTRRKDFYQKLKMLRSHGIEREPSRLVRPSEAGNPWYYEMTALGFNYRLTDIQCALGLSQLKKLPGFIARRREIAAYYDSRFSTMETLTTPAEPSDRRSSWHLYILRMDFGALGKSRRQVMEELRALGIGTQVHYIPVTRQPYYTKVLKERPERYPETESYYRETLSIPLFPAMTKAEEKRVARAVERVCRPVGRKGKA